MVVKLWSQLDWTGRNTPESTLSATDIFTVIKLYQVELPEIWELILMVEKRVFSYRQGKIERRRKQEEMKKKARNG
tara:strand:- start:3324 stop:3551 length:228 start_codon:yes stop_codon:yes gene_type:complete